MSVQYWQQLRVIQLLKLVKGNLKNLFSHFKVITYNIYIGYNSIDSYDFPLVFKPNLMRINIWDCSV